MWLRFKFSLFLPPLYFSLSLSFSLYFSVSRVPPSSLFNALPFFSPLYFISLCLFPLFRSLFGFLPMRRYLLSLSSLQHFYHHAIFFPCLFIPSFSVSIAYTYANLPSSLFFVVLSLTPIHLLTFSRVLRPTCANAIYTYSLRILSRTLTHSLRFFHGAIVFVWLAGLVGFSLRSTTFSSPLYSVLPSRNRAENLRIEPSRALLSGRKKDRCIERRYV